MTTLTSFPRLMSPGRIGPTETPNRIVLPGKDVNLSEIGMIVPREIDHYAARVAGGAGLMTTGACAIAFSMRSASMKEPGLSDDKFLPGIKALADAVHAAGSKLCVQSTHHGKVARVDIVNERPVLAPSKPDYHYDMAALADCRCLYRTRSGDCDSLMLGTGIQKMIQGTSVQRPGCAWLTAHSRVPQGERCQRLVRVGTLRYRAHLSPNLRPTAQ